MPLAVRQRGGGSEGVPETAPPLQVGQNTRPAPNSQELVKDSNQAEIFSC